MRHFSTFFHISATGRSSAAAHVPLLVGGDPLHALRGPVRGSGDLHRHPPHLRSGHHPAASAASSASSPGSTARRSRHLDAEIREDPDHRPPAESAALPRLVQQTSRCFFPPPISGITGINGDIDRAAEHKQHASSSSSSSSSVVSTLLLFSNLRTELSGSSSRCAKPNSPRSMDR